MSQVDETWTEIEIEASLYLWETFLDTDNEHTKNLQKNWNSSTIRHDCIHASKPFLTIYDGLTKDNPDLFEEWSYDWEVVPAFLIAAFEYMAPYMRKEYVLTEVFSRHGKEIGEHALRILRDEPEVETLCECGKTLEACTLEPCS